MLLIRASMLMLALLQAPHPDPDLPIDRSQADIDGPHVFYRDNGVVVKSVEWLDTAAVPRQKVFPKPGTLKLHCQVSATSEHFTFHLKEKLEIEPDTYTLPDRMLVLSDIEGNFLAFKNMLKGLKVVDEKYNWAFGNGHLVLLGDFFDRGLNVTECLWLIYKLESEAEAAGGKVHFILGNHEVLNLSGQTAYVRRKYIENAKLIGEDYKKWFDTSTELGRWLRTKNAVEKIGDYVFCHGGISPELAHSDVPFSDINRLSRQYLGKTFETILAPAGRAVFDPNTGVFWFRDAARNRLSLPEVDAALAYAGAKYMVIGHTLVPKVSSLYNGRVFCVDLFHEENLRRGVIESLFIEKGRPYSINNLGEKWAVAPVPMRVEIAEGE